MISVLQTFMPNRYSSSDTAPVMKMKTVSQTRQDGQTFYSLVRPGDWFTSTLCEFQKVCPSAATIVTTNLSNICTLFYALSKFDIHISLGF